MAGIESFPPLLMSFQKRHEEVSAHRDEVEEVGARAQEILDETHVSSRMGCQATQLTSRYQALLLQVLVRGGPAAHGRPTHLVRPVVFLH
jgi:hypothetical protein